MISRVADHCFWLGRYLERAEATARLLSVTRNLALDGELTPLQCWRPVLIVSGEEPRFVKEKGEEAEADGEVVQNDLTWNEANLSSIVRSVGALRENARSIREVISLEVWEAVNELYLWLGSDAGKAEYTYHRYGFYRHVRNGCQLVMGLLRSTMLHGSPLNFIWLGIRLERTGQTARVVDVHHHALTLLERSNRLARAELEAGSLAGAEGPRSNQVVETALWLSLLRACSGFEPFMKKAQGKVNGDAVAAFLIFEKLFPRSVAFGLDAAFESFVVIRPPAERDLPGERTHERLRILNHWLSERGREPFADGVHDLLTHVIDETAAICETLGQEMLGYPPSTSGEAAQ